MNTLFRWPAALVAMLVALLAGCGGNADDIAFTGQQLAASCENLQPGDPDAGAALFANTLEATGAQAPRCSSCHAITNDDLASVGPGLQNIARVAETRVPDQTAQEYLCRAIIAPQEMIVPGYEEDMVIMPVTYGAYLTQTQLNDLVAYLMTLEET